MNRQNKKSETNSGHKLKATTIIAVFLLIFISINHTKSDKLCETLVVDSITTLYNGTIAIFSNKEVWFLDQKSNQLLGPCPIVKYYKEMSGPVDAALTIGQQTNDSISEYDGSSVYFENKNFYTLKNLGQFQVEWGAIVYLPHKGQQTDLAKDSSDAQKYLKQTITYSYFDPIDIQSKFVFSDGTVLSFIFNFEKPSQYVTPEVTTIKDELNKYGLKEVPPTLTAAFTQTKSNVSQLFLFKGSTFCSIKLSAESEAQNCDLRPIKEFLNCDSIKITNDLCSENTLTVTSEKPIVAKVSPKPVTRIIEKKSKPESKVKIRSDDSPVAVKPKQAISGSHSLVINCLVFALTFISIYLILN